MYKIIGRYLPKVLIDKYRKLLFYANIKIEAERFVGFIFSFGLIVSIFIAFDLKIIFSFPFWIAFILSFLGIEVFLYFWLLLKADSRAKFIEDVLPDALQLIASNLRAGFTTDKALLLSSRPEFGPLKEEFDIVAKKIMTGEDLGNALIEMTKRVKSKKFEKAIFLIVTGLKSGGQLAQLLSDTAKSLIEQKFIEAMVKSNILTYIIFTFAAVGIGAPMLFGLSSFFVSVLTKILATINIPEAAMATGISVPFATICPS